MTSKIKKQKHLEIIPQKIEKRKIKEESVYLRFSIFSRNGFSLAFSA
jgi:hypothetical protein